MRNFATIKLNDILILIGLTNTKEFREESLCIVYPCNDLYILRMAGYFAVHDS